MKSGSHVALTALATIVLGLQCWMLTRLGRAEAATTPVPPVASVAATVDLLDSRWVAARPGSVATLTTAAPETSAARPALAVAPEPGRSGLAANAVPALPVAIKPAAPPAARPTFDRIAAERPAEVAVLAATEGSTHAPRRAAAATQPDTATAPAESVLLAAATTASPLSAAPAAEPVGMPPTGVPPPVYATRIPPPATVSYKLSRGGISGSGSLVWQPDAKGYVVKLEGAVAIIGSIITQISRGTFDAGGLAPVRFTDKRLRRSELAANFQRKSDGSGEVTFSGSTGSVPLFRGTQDRVSVMVQLAAIAEAWTKPPSVGEQVLVHVVGARADEARWALRYEGFENVRTVDGNTVQALKFERPPDSPHDTRAEFWLDPAQHHMPVRARLSDGSSEPFELLRLGKVE